MSPSRKARGDRSWRSRPPPPRSPRVPAEGGVSLRGPGWGAGAPGPSWQRPSEYRVPKAPALSGSGANLRLSLRGTTDPAPRFCTSGLPVPGPDDAPARASSGRTRPGLTTHIPGQRPKPLRPPRAAPVREPKHLRHPQ